MQTLHSRTKLNGGNDGAVAREQSTLPSLLVALASATEEQKAQKIDCLTGLLKLLQQQGEKKYKLDATEIAAIIEIATGYSRSQDPDIQRAARLIFAHDHVRD